MWKFYSYALISSLSLDQYLLIIYLLSIDYTMTQVGVGYAVFQIVYIITEIPSSYIGDKFGRKKVLFLGGVFKGGSAYFWLSANGDLYPIIFANILMALSITMVSNSDIALLHDSIKGKTENFKQDKVSWFMTLITIGMTAGGIIGGLITFFLNFQVLYITEISLSLIMLINVLLLPNIPVAKEKTEIQKGSNIIVKSLKSIKFEAKSIYKSWQKANAKLITLMIIALFYWTFSSLNSQFIEPLLSKFGLLTVMVTVIFTVASFADIVGNRSSAKLTSESSLNIWLQIMPWVYASGTLVITVAIFVNEISFTVSIILVILGLIIAKFVSGFNDVVLNAQILNLAPESIKATTISSIDTVQALFMAIAFPSLGYVSETLGFQYVFLILTFIFVIQGIVLFIWKKNTVNNRYHKKNYANSN